MRHIRCHVLIGVDANSLLAGAKAVEQALIKELADKGLADEVQVIETGSLGPIGQGVILVVYPDAVAYANVTVDDVPEIVTEHLLKGRPVKRLQVPLAPEERVVEIKPTGLVKKPQPRVVLQNCGVIDPESLEEAIAAGDYQALVKVIEEGMSPKDVMEEVTKSGLRGRGGAGFPTGKKWSFTAPGPQKYLICNADEGEPGTFKDRLILEGDPHRLIESMILAGYAIGATKGYIYIRGEYTLSIARISKAIEQAYRENLLGDNILDSGITFHLEIKKGAGAYVCGEETALIESIEGKRGQPRLKPPFPAVQGLWGKPTVVNNVETLSNIPPIILNGADWYRSFGTPTCPGTKVYTILGHIETPGLIEVEMGTTLRDIIFEYGGGIRKGKKFKGALVGGAAGAFLNESQLDVQMDYDSLKEYAAVLGSGAILVMDEETSVVSLLHSILSFFEHESCGQCTPCRMGTRSLLTIMERIVRGQGTEKDLDLLLQVSENMQVSSLCPLGQSPILPIKSALDYFRDEFLERVSGKWTEPPLQAHEEASQVG